MVALALPWPRVSRPSARSTATWCSASCDRKVALPLYCAVIGPTFTLTMPRYSSPSTSCSWAPGRHGAMRSTSVSTAHARSTGSATRKSLVSSIARGPPRCRRPTLWPVHGTSRTSSGLLASAPGHPRRRSSGAAATPRRPAAPGCPARRRRPPPRSAASSGAAATARHASAVTCGWSARPTTTASWPAAAAYATASLHGGGDALGPRGRSAGRRRRARRGRSGRRRPARAPPRRGRRPGPRRGRGRPAPARRPRRGACAPVRPEAANRSPAPAASTTAATRHGADGIRVG